MDGDANQTTQRKRYSREFFLTLRDKHTWLSRGPELLGDLHIGNANIVVSQEQVRSPQSTSSRYQFSRLINHPDDGNVVRSPTRGGGHHHGHASLVSGNSGRFSSSSLTQSREHSARWDDHGRWDAHKSLEPGSREGSLSGSLPSNSSSRWVKASVGDDGDDWRNKRGGTTRNAWQDGGGGHRGSSASSNPVWADVSVDPSQRIEMHGADVIEQEREKMKEAWRKEVEERKRADAAGGGGVQQEEIGDDEIEMWKAAQEQEDGTDHAGGVRDALERRKEEVMQRASVDASKGRGGGGGGGEEALRSEMAGMAVRGAENVNYQGELEGKVLLAMLGGGSKGVVGSTTALGGQHSASSAAMSPNVRPEMNLPPNMMHPGMSVGMMPPHMRPAMNVQGVPPNVRGMVPPGMQMPPHMRPVVPPSMQNMQMPNALPPGMHIQMPMSGMPPGFHPGMAPQGGRGMPVPIGQGPPGAAGVVGGPSGGGQVPMGRGLPTHGMPVRPGQQVNVAALFGGGRQDGGTTVSNAPPSDR